MHQPILDIKKEDICITEDYTLLEAANAIKIARHRGVLVLNDAEKVCGFISQGDIIDAIRDGVSLYARVGTVLKPSFLYLREKDYKKALPIFQGKLISILPVVDDDFHLTDVITLRDILDHATFDFMPGEEDDKH